MAEALVLIETETSVKVEEDTLREVGLEEIFRKVAGMKEVTKAATITGNYDIVAWMKTDDIDEITGPLVDRIRAFEGVKKTVTNVIIRSK